MNTIRKYILEEETINPLNFKIQNFKTLEIWIESSSGKKLLQKEIQLNSSGQIKKIKRYKDTWTTYPPLKFETDNEIKRGNFSFEETLVWNKNEELSHIKILNLNSNEFSIRQFNYSNGRVKEILENGYQKSYLFNENNYIVKIEKSTLVERIGKMKTTIKFNLNELGQILEKQTSISLYGGKPEILSLEKFEYNKQGKIIKSITTFNQEHHVREETNFHYLSDDQNLLKEIKISGSSESSFEFKYDEFQNLNSVIAKKGKEDYTKTIYKLKKT